MHRIIMIVFLLLAIAAGCGRKEPAEGSNGNAIEAAPDEEYSLPEADVYLVVLDSIGLELGDSNFVFGRISGVDLTPDGNMAVLDMQKSCVSFFSPAGEFIHRVGRQGSGPGEFLLPAGIAFFPLPAGNNQPDSLIPGFAVSDAMGGKLVYFDAAMNYMRDVQGFFPSPPAVLAGVDGGAVVGMKPEFDQNERGMFVGFTIGRWEMGETEPSAVYFESMSPFDPTDLSGMQDDLVNFGASREGLVLTAPISTEEYTFSLWSPEGGELFSFVRDDFVRVRKTRTEMELEAEMVNAMMVQQGMPESMANWEPDPYRPAVAGLWFDGMDRIWVTRGTTMTASFDVYDLEGNLLFTAALDAGERARTWQVVIKHDMFLAFDANPELYPQLFFGSLPGFEGGEQGIEGI